MVGATTFSGNVTQGSFKPKDSLKYSVKGFLGNALSSMPSYSYYIRLSICHPVILHNLSLNNNQKITIAETGTTSVFNLTDLDLFHSVSWNNETRGAMGVGCNISIVETHGSALLDYLNQACQDLSIKAPKEAGYILEIMFKNGNAEKIEPGESEYYFVYPLVFKSMTITITEQGAQYRISAVEPGIHSVYGNVGPITKNNCSLPAKDLGEWVDAFNAYLNDAAQQEVDSKNHGIRDRYAIYIEEKWRSWKFANLENGPDENSQTGRYHLDPSKLIVQIAKGSNIPDILAAVVGSTTEMQKLETSQGKTLRQSPDGDATAANDVVKYWKVTSDMRFGKYDKTRKKYSRLYLYAFTPFLESAVYPPELSDQFNNEKTMKERVTKLINEQLLAKRYDYNYTGINTEVIRFDMQLDLTYFRALPVRAGHQKRESHRQNANKTDIKNPVGTTNNGGAYSPAQASSFGADVTVADLLQADQKALAKETQTNVRAGSGLFLESYAMPEDREEINFFTVPADTIDQGDGLSGTVTPDKSRGLIKFGDAYMELSGGNEFHTIDIEIKGDPYWLGMSNLTKQFRNANTGVAEFALYEKGGLLFWLNVKSPKEPDPLTGKMEFDDNTTISGIFKVKKVISRFVNGSFTQTLEATRDMGTNFKKAKKTLLTFTDEVIQKRNQDSTDGTEFESNPPQQSQTTETYTSEGL
tara:strand:+ start:1316 stop:3409 length:2094 start_codon:yes stop_codon:yes gene_type:complete